MSMTGQTLTRMRIECTECEFVTTLTRSDGGWSAEPVADHAERTGHVLRSVPLDD